MNIKDCLEKGYLVKTKPDEELGNKELNESKYDLNKAEEAFENEDSKWCIVKCYYSMFHAAKAVLFKLGYVEKRHIAILIVLEELNKQGKIESKFITNFKASMTAREDADYHYSYSKEIAEYELDIAKEFVKEMERILGLI
ncbi:MAG: HEPN domain-containing protein [Candidatus Woesearchaeota archaeon]|nr:HEPN domain-containing protein [Candidatus Woesearchaeota archaeon]